MSYDYVPADYLVFEEGDEASLFYVILEGSIGVFIRDQTAEEVAEEEQARKEAKKAADLFKREQEKLEMKKKLKEQEKLNRQTLKGGVSASRQSTVLNLNFGALAGESAQNQPIFPRFSVSASGSGAAFDARKALASAKLFRSNTSNLSKDSYDSCDAPDNNDDEELQFLPIKEEDEDEEDNSSAASDLHKNNRSRSSSHSNTSSNNSNSSGSGDTDDDDESDASASSCSGSDNTHQAEKQGRRASIVRRMSMEVQPKFDISFDILHYNFDLSRNLPYHLL